MRSAFIYAGHLVMAGALLVLVVYPFAREYDYYVVRNEGRSIDLTGLIARYAYAAGIAWFLTGPLGFFLVERIWVDAPVRTRVAWSAIVGFFSLAAFSVLMGTNLLFADRIHRPTFVKWMDLFLAEFQFISFIGYSLLLSAVSTITQYLLRRP